MNDIEIAAIVSWEIFSVDKTALVLRLDQVQSDSELQGYLAKIRAPNEWNATLTPHQALDLAKDLARSANRILAQKTPHISDLQ